jgi:rare lipoprotein A
LSDAATGGTDTSAANISAPSPAASADTDAEANTGTGLTPPSDFAQDQSTAAAHPVATPVWPIAGSDTSAVVSKSLALVQLKAVGKLRLGRELGEGIASWYGPRFYGRRTANGEKFDRYALTAANKTLPLGTRVVVSNPRTGKQIVVRINDRGPYLGNRILDLSEAAAKALGFKTRGLDWVVMNEVLPPTATPAAGTQEQTSDFPAAPVVTAEAQDAEPDYALALKSPPEAGTAAAPANAAKLSPSGAVIPLAKKRTRAKNTVFRSPHLPGSPPRTSDPVAYAVAISAAASVQAAANDNMPGR